MRTDSEDDVVTAMLEHFHSAFWEECKRRGVKLKTVSVHHIRFDDGEMRWRVYPTVPGQHGLPDVQPSTILSQALQNAMDWAKESGNTAEELAANLGIPVEFAS